MDGYNKGSHSVREISVGRFAFLERQLFLCNHRLSFHGNCQKYIEEQRTEEHKRKYMKSGKYKKQKS